MNFIKRAFLSVKARKVKSLILFGVFIVITNLVLAGFAMQNVTETANDLVRKKLGVDVTVGFNYEIMQEYALQQREENPGEPVQFPELLTEEADKLAKSDYVKNYNYINEENGVADGFNPINAEQNEGAVGGAIGGGQGEMQMPDLAVSGVKSSELMKEFAEGIEKVVEGDPITDEDKGKKVALIEKQLAEHNDIAIGDEIKIQNAEGSSTLKLEVIGIYETSDMSSQNDVAPPMFHPANKIYVPYESVKEITASKDKQATGIDKAIYYLNDPENIEAFKEEGKKTDIDFELFKMDAHDTLYKKMIGPIENMATTSKWIIYLVSITGSIILGLIIMLTIKERRKELGILLSIGEKKGKLIGQLLVEVVCIAILAFSLSIFTGEAVAQKMGDSLLEKEITAYEEQQHEQSNGGNTMMFFGEDPDQGKDVEPIDNIDVKVTFQDMMQLGIVGFLIAILSTIIPALSILRLNPKEILLKDE